MLPTLQIKLLAGFSLIYNNQPLTGLTSDRLQALLAYLVLHRNTPQARQQLAFQFWPDSSDSQARTNLRRELHHLRQTLPEVDLFLRIDAKSLQWNSDASFSLDVAEFERAFAAAEAAEKASEWERARELSEQAIQLYGGDLLPTCEDEWIQSEREQLRQKLIQALESLIHLAERQTDHRAAIRAAHRLLDIEPLHEGSYAALMRSHQAMGERATALRLYHRCMTMLREELGVDPSASTRQIYEQLLREEEIEATIQENAALENSVSSSNLAQPQLQIDWGEAIDVSTFYGREAELATLQEWVMSDRCRLILLLGMGGIGKTALAVKIAQQVSETHFQFVIWRSLRNAPSLETVLSDLVPFLSHQKDTKPEIGRLVHWLRAHPCLVIFDNLETIFQSGDRAGNYRSGYENYGELFSVLGETLHQSCVILTSREKPAEVAVLEGGEAVKTLQLTGSLEAAQALLKTRGLTGTAEQQRLLAEQYGANPLALKIVASSILDLFEGDIEAFLQQETILFNGLRRLLEQQFDRLSLLEQTIMYWLAVNREWTTLAELAEDILPPVPRAKLLEALESLTWRNLIEKRSGSYTQQPVVMEYVTDELTEQVAIELSSQELILFNRIALTKTTVKDYVRESQTRLILEAISNKLCASLNLFSSLETHLQNILVAIRNSTATASYATGNLINLCIYLQLDLTGWNFSDLTLRHADLRAATLQHVNFENTTFVQSTFTQTFSAVLSVAFSPNNAIAAIAEMGQVRLWRVVDGYPLVILQGHTSRVYSVAWHPNGQILASGSDDRTIRLWDVETGRCLATLQGHTNSVWCVTWHPDGKVLASSGTDQTIKLWSIENFHCISTLKGHQNIVWCVAWSPDGKILASGSDDQTIRLWDVESGRCLTTFEAEGNWVRSIAWSPDGKRIANASTDSVIRMWEVATGQCLKTLIGHTRWIYSVAWSADGGCLASSSDDCTIKLWNPDNGQCLRTLQEHQNSVWAVSWSSDGKILASGSYDETVKFWDRETGQCLKTLKGYSNWIRCGVWSPDGSRIASGSADKAVRIWDVTTGECLKSLTGHQGWVLSVAWNPDGNTLVSSGTDEVAKLWDVTTGECLRTITGHTSWIWSVAWSPDGQRLATGSSTNDLTARLWNAQSGEWLKIFSGHQSWIWWVIWSPDGTMIATAGNDQMVKLWDVQTGRCLRTLQAAGLLGLAIAWSPDGKVLATSSVDQTVKLWNIQTGKCLKSLQGHTGLAWAIAYSPDGEWLVSGSDDCTIRVWHVKSGRCHHVLDGHHGLIWHVSFSPDGQRLASSSDDQTIRVWDIQTGVCVQTLRSKRPYEGMNIAGVNGLSDAQKAALQALGAIESSQL